MGKEKISYSEKLRDPRWQRKRLEILSRDNWQCTKCGAGDKTLHVHHIKYSGEPWDASNDILRTLCEKCHKEEGDCKPIEMLEFAKHCGITESELVELLGRVGWRVTESESKSGEVKKILNEIYPGFENHWANYSA